MKKKWQYYEQDKEIVNKIAEEHGISTLLAKILVNRGIVDSKQIKVFLEPQRHDFHNPFDMLDMEMAVNRIIEAINNKEKTIIYGDYDVDGITSITVLKKFLNERGLDVDYYIPNRLEEGYGLNKEAIEEIAKKGYKLMITVDCGISGVEEVELANSLGIETIITDHHEQLDVLPNAYAIINPKRRDNTYPFRGLAGVGVVFKVIQAGIREITRQKELYRDYPFRQKMDELQNAARSLAQTLLNRDGVRKNYHRVSPPVVVSKKGEAQTAEKPQDKPGLSCGNEKKKVKTKTASVKKQAKPKL